MARPRIFVSSTYYDLKYIRKDLESFIKSMGYEPILFESGDIAFHHDLPLDESCYKEIENSNMQVLIIGGRYGSKTSYPEEGDMEKVAENKMYDFYNSITKREYQEARTKGIPIFVFVDSGVYSEYKTYKRNKDNDTIKYAHVDSINIFKLLDDIISQRLGNYVKDFENFEDISHWLKDQWAGLFADYLSKRQYELEMKTLSSQINELESITKTLKEYVEEIMKQTNPEDYQEIITKQELRMERLKAKRFCSEDLIGPIISKFKPDGDAMDIFGIFKKSSNFKEFLRNIGIKKQDINGIMGAVGPEAEREYLYYRRKYLEDLGQFVVERSTHVRFPVER